MMAAGTKAIPEIQPGSRCWTNGYRPGLRRGTVQRTDSQGLRERFAWPGSAIVPHAGRGAKRQTELGAEVLAQRNDYGRQIFFGGHRCNGSVLPPRWAQILAAFKAGTADECTAKDAPLRMRPLLPGLPQDVEPPRGPRTHLQALFRRQTLRAVLPYCSLVLMAAAAAVANVLVAASRCDTTVP